jgi:Ca-activated chloride channel homolog
MKQAQRVSKMILGVEKKLLWPAFLIGVLAIFLSAPAAKAQKSVKDLPPPPPLWKPKPTPTPKPKPVEPEVIDVIKTTSNLVMVPVSVTDQTGNAVQGLQVADFRLQEEGKQQEISGIGDPEQVPLAIALLFDISSSVGSKGFFASQQNAAAAFLKLVMKPNDRAAIFSITGTPTLLQPLSSADASAAKMLTIPQPTSSVPTAFYDAVDTAAKYLTDKAPSNYRRVIVVLSDGDDNFSSMTRGLAIADYNSTASGQQAAGTRSALQLAHQRAVTGVQKTVQQADAIFYSVNPGGPSIKLNQIAMRAERGMEAIAEATGGTAFVPDSDKDLERVFRQVAAELRGQYLLQYYADSDKIPAGQFRRIQVSVPARNDVRVRARQGYYAKKQD